jgi:hypothetical protein
MNEMKVSAGIWGQIHEKISEKLPIWGGRAALAAIACLITASLILEIAHKTGALSAFHMPPDLITEALLVCTFGLCFFAVEQSAKTETSFESFRHRVSAEIDQMKNTVTALQGEVKDNCASTAQSISALRHSQNSALEIMGFAGSEEFRLHWSRLLDRHQNIALWGRFGPDFTKDFKTIRARGRDCSYYMSVEEDTQDVAGTFLLSAEEAHPDSFRLFETSSFGNLSWIIGYDLSAQTADVLLCCSVLGDSQFSGVYMTGKKAWRFYQAVLPRLEARSALGQNSVPLRVYTQQQIDRILSEKVSFKRALAEVDKGEILRGVEEVCEGMVRQLHESKKFVDITHVCSEETIPLFRSSEFAPWLEANYAAADNIKITRIFILPRSLRANPTLKEVISEMRQRNINILVCDIEDLDEGCIEDFSLYDDRHVIYIDRSGGGAWIKPGDWRHKGDTEARRSDSRDRVTRYRTIFDIIYKKALKNSGTVRI